MSSTGELALIHRSTAEEIFQLCENELRQKYFYDTGSGFPNNSDEWSYFSVYAKQIAGQIGAESYVHHFTTDLRQLPEVEVGIQINKREKTVTWDSPNQLPVVVPMPSSPFFLVYNTGNIFSFAELLQ